MEYFARKNSSCKRRLTKQTEPCRFPLDTADRRDNSRGFDGNHKIGLMERILSNEDPYKLFVGFCPLSGSDHGGSRRFRTTNPSKPQRRQYGRTSISRKRGWFTGEWVSSSSKCQIGIFSLFGESSTRVKHPKSRQEK